ncbi:MAG: hypothetical protein JNL11_20685 [Bdellovibrionaceae bacterium]|nr:hypothetical protein [Pseudobdellovibrionaceae bacterium]
MKKTMKVISIITLMLGSLNVFALDSKSDAGTVIGGVVGGVVGNQIGGGVIGTGIGIIAGAVIGSSIGKSLDRMDQQALQDAQRDALRRPVGSVVEWDGARYGSRTGSYGRFTTTRNGYHRSRQNETCRSYRNEIHSRGRSEVRTGNTCQRYDGSWYEVRNSEVAYY